MTKYGSISRAAEILHNNQPNVTKFMNNLESQLSCHLMIRSNKGVTLTPEGEKLYAHVQIAYSQLKEAERELSGVGKLLADTVQIGTAETALHGVLLDVLAKFRRLYPGIRLRITNGSTSGTAMSLQRGLLDLAVVTSPINSLPGTKSTPLFSFEEILVAASSSEFSKKRRITPGEVFTHPIVSLGRHAKTYEFYSHLFLPYGLEWQPDIDLATSDQILPLVKAGLVVGFVPEFMERQDQNQNTVVPIKVAGLKPTRAIVLLEGKTESLSAAAAELKRMMLAGAEPNTGTLGATDGRS